MRFISLWEGSDIRKVHRVKQHPNPPTKGRCMHHGHNSGTERYGRVTYCIYNAELEVGPIKQPKSRAQRKQDKVMATARKRCEEVAKL